MLKHKCAKALQRNSLWEQEYPVNPQRPSWHWRWSSSWNKPGGRWVSFGELPKQKKAEGQRVDPWYSELQLSQEIFREKMAEIRKRVEEDPFRAIFGRKADRACIDWSPLIWGLRKKAGRESGVVEGSPTTIPSQSKLVKETENETKASKPVVDGIPGPMSQQQGGILTSETARAVATSPRDPTTVPTNDRLGNDHTSFSGTTTEDLVIDPITLRKVPRTAANVSGPNNATMRHDEESTNIPVKKFAAYNTRPNKVGEADDVAHALETELSKYEAPLVVAQSTPAHERPSDPVAKGLEDYELRVLGETQSPEGLRSTQEDPLQESSRPNLHRKETKLPLRDFATTVETPPEPRSQPPQIESSLSRSLRNSAQRGLQSQPEENTKLRYNEFETTVEDIDLLRASDVRAASGRPGRPRMDTEEERWQRRRKLVDAFTKPQDMDTQYAEEMATQKVASLREIRSREPPVPETEAFGYDPTPQGLQTSYDRDMQNRIQTLENAYAAEVEREEAALREAEIDSFDRRPQCLETSFAGEQGSQKSEGLQFGGTSVHDAMLEEPDVDQVSKSSQRLERFSAPEHATPSSHTFGQQEGELQNIEANDREGTSHTFENPFASNINQRQGEGDMSTNVHKFAVRHSGYNGQASQSTNNNASSISKEVLAEDGLCTIQNVHGASRGTFQQESNTMPSKAEIQDAGVERGLEVYDNKLDRQAYHFHTGQDSLEADILAQSKQQTPEGVTDRMPAPYSSFSNPDGLAMRWEEEEQKLHEEIRETNEILSEAKAELRRIIASQEMSEPVSVVGREASESGGTPEQSALPSTASNAKATEVEEQTGPVMDASPSVYRIVAYDIHTQNVVTVMATSSIISPNETPISLPEAISRLTNPAQFLPHLRHLQAAGYEVVSANSEVLVFKKVQEPDGQGPVADPVIEPTSADRRRPMNPIDGTTTQTGNFASPTGFVNYDVVFPAPFPEQAPPYAPAAPSRTGGRVRREEDVFSGSSPRWQDPNRRPEKPRGAIRKAATRVFWVGAWTAGCCYAVGVIAEFFRTGGADGLGAQGF